MIEEREYDWTKIRDGFREAAELLQTKAPSNGKVDMCDGDKCVVGWLSKVYNTGHGKNFDKNVCVFFQKLGIDTKKYDSLDDQKINKYMSFLHENFEIWPLAFEHFTYSIFGSPQTYVKKKGTGTIDVRVSDVIKRFNQVADNITHLKLFDQNDFENHKDNVIELLVKKTPCPSHTLNPNPKIKEQNYV